MKYQKFKPLIRLIRRIFLLVRKGLTKSNKKQNWSDTNRLVSESYIKHGYECMSFHPYNLVSNFSVSQTGTENLKRQ